MRSTRLLALTAVLVPVLWACQGPPDILVPIDGTGDIGQASRPINGGAAPDEPMHDAVVSLHQLVGGSVHVSPFCSGTLVSDSVVLTAAHCLDASKNPRKPRARSPGSLAIYVGDAPTVNNIVANLYLVSEVKIHPSYDPQRIRDDLGLVRLQSAVPATDVTPVAHLPSSLGLTSADIGATINFAGFGQTGTGSSGVKLQVDGTLEAFGCGVSGCPSTGDTATQFSYTPASSGPCLGDSGGPAFIIRNTTPYVAGTTSYGDSNCTVYGVSNRVDAYQTWIDAFVSPPPTPDCSADGTCNPACEPGADPDCASPCFPSGTACTSHSDYCPGMCHPKKKTCK
jgi:secreted trypsin-like serine protease